MNTAITHHPITPHSNGGSYSSSLSVNCSTCVAGRYSASSSSSCTDCDAGKWSAAGAPTCTSCGVGTYASGEGNTACTNCQQGSYASSPTSSECIWCSEGYFSPNMGATSCLKVGYIIGRVLATTCAVSDFGTSPHLQVCHGSPVGQLFTTSNSPSTFLTIVLPRRLSKCATEDDPEGYTYGPEYTSAEGSSTCDRCVATHFMNDEQRRLLWTATAADCCRI